MSTDLIHDDLAALVIKTMAEGVCLIRATDKLVVYANPRFTTLLGYDAGQLDGEPADDLVHERAPGAAERIIASVGAQLDGSNEAMFEARLRRKDGTPLWGRVRMTTFHDPEHGQLWVAVLKNIESEKRLRRQEQVLRTVAEQLPVGLWLIDEHGTITYGNPAGQEIWRGARYVGIESYGEYRAWRVNAGEPIASADWGAARALNQRETSVGEVLRIQCFDGTFKTILHSAAPLIGDDDDVFGAVVVNQDITSLQEAIRARDEILAVVAHDLRGPLNSIGLRAFALEEELGALAAPGTAIRSWLDGISRGVEEINKHVEDLLDVARLERGEFALELGELEVAELIAEALERAAASAEGRALQTELQTPLPVLVADRRRMIQVLDNLLGNAVKFTSSTDTITVGAAREESDLHLWVSDTGPGIEPEQLPLVFQRGWQADATDPRGAGLGLAIVRDIVHAHGGRVWVTCEPGSGATFHVLLPVGSS